MIDELVANTVGGTWLRQRRFFAWVSGGSLTAALAADWLTATWDQNAALYACGPAAAVVEEIAGTWLKDLLGLPPEASFAFTTGCQLPHSPAWPLPAMRCCAMPGGMSAPRGCSVPHRCASSPVTSDTARSTAPCAISAWAPAALSPCRPTRTAESIPPPSGRSSRPVGPTIVVLDAGDLNIAAFDPFAELIPLAKAAGAWVHIDGAFGLVACASRSKRPLLAGIDRADSWATDGHKWLNVPFDSGLAAGDREAHRASMTISANYIAAEGGARDQINWNPEWSRRARGFALYAALRELGRTGVDSSSTAACAGPGPRNRDWYPDWRGGAVDAALEPGFGPLSRPAPGSHGSGS